MFIETQSLGELSDYVKAGDSFYWAGNVSGLQPGGGFYLPGIYSGSRSWSDTFNNFLALLRGEGFQITKSEANEDAGSIAINIKAPIDFSDTQDVNGLIAGIAGQAGFNLRATNLQRGERNLASEQPSPWTNPIGNAATFWGDEIKNAGGSFWAGITGGDSSNLILIAVIAVAGIVLLKR